MAATADSDMSERVRAVFLWRSNFLSLSLACTPMHKHLHAHTHAHTHKHSHPYTCTPTLQLLFSLSYTPPKWSCLSWCLGKKLREKRKETASRRQNTDRKQIARQVWFVKLIDVCRSIKWHSINFCFTSEETRRRSRWWWNYFGLTLSHSQIRLIHLSLSSPTRTHPCSLSLSFRRPLVSSHYQSPSFL